MRGAKLEVYEAAVKLAQSGKMENWRSIQQGLVEQGFRAAPDLLDDDRIRTVLDICCDRSRRTHEAVSRA